MPHRPMAIAALLAACGAAWFAARYALFLPALWIALLLVVLAVQPTRRTLVPTPWLLVVVAIVVVSWFVAYDHEGALRHGLLLLAAVLVFGLARAGAPPGELYRALALAVTLTAIAALVQFLGGLEGARSDVVTLAPGLRDAAQARLGVGRAFGTASLPGHCAILLVMSFPLVLDGAHRSRGPWRWSWWTAAALAAAGVVATRSLAAAAVGVVLIGLAVWRRRTRGTVAALALLVVAAALVVGLRGDLSSLEPLRLRWVNWQTAAWVFSQHPLVGVGLGGVGQAGLVGPTGAANISPYAHCVPLELAAEFGIGGLGLVLVAGVALFRLLRVGAQSEPALALAVAAVPLHNLVDFSLYSPEVLLPWAALAGALAAQCLPPLSRPTAATVLVPILTGGVLVSALSWRCESDTDAALLLPREEAIPTLVEAARWQPWSQTPLLVAADLAIRGDASESALATIIVPLERRGWVRPASPAWAEALARLRLAQRRPGEALPWALEARRRAPWRNDLADLERMCAGEP